MPFTQQNQLLAVQTMLGDDMLLLQSFSGSEGISAPFRYDIVLLSENDSIDLHRLLGTSITMRVLLADGSQRFWNGQILRISQGSRGKVFTSYHAEVVPWLWFLGLKHDCRIFQEKSVVEIVKDVFAELGLHDFEFRLRGEPPKREYCVQYRESDFQFVSRLLEEEGIFYFFEHQNGKHILVMANQSGAHTPCPGQPSVTILPSPESTLSEDIITDVRRQEQVVPSAYALDDYNFQTPSADLSASIEGDNAFQVYDYPGLYPQRKQGESLARIRKEEVSMQSVTIRGESTCRAFTSGYSFKLRDHYRKEWNQEYVLVEVTHHATQADYFSGSSADETSFLYQNGFTCIPRSVAFRPPRRTPIPVIDGCQTAVVVGPEGEEIYTDKYGRIKVQFHWDRRGRRDDKSSCWIRVAQDWAGKNWGSVSIPRIGQEVVVAFLEGNPNRPMILGRVYNAEQMPPYALPAGADMMGFKSNSTKGGGGYNEIVIKDTKNSELIRMHSQKDMDVTVEGDSRQLVGGAQHITAQGEHRQKIAGDMSLQVGGERHEKVGVLYVLESGQEIHLKSGMKVVIEAATQVTLRGPNGFVDIGPAGVVIQGTSVLINSGGSGATGSGSNPKEPQLPGGEKKAES